MDKSNYRKQDDMLRRAQSITSKFAPTPEVDENPSSMDKEYMRYKKGGCVKKSKEMKCGGKVHKEYAAGGVAKIRHKQATPSGAPRRMAHRRQM